MTLSGWTPIMVAASQGHIDTVKYLASKSAELDLKDKNDQTIIHLAAQNNQVGPDGKLSVFKSLQISSSSAGRLAEPTFSSSD